MVEDNIKVDPVISKMSDKELVEMKEKIEREEQGKQILKTNELNDSVELGAASKEGKLKIYFDASDPDDAKTRVEAAISIMELAKKQFSEKIKK